MASSTIDIISRWLAAGRPAAAGGPAAAAAPTYDTRSYLDIY
jgi:hypothetical protein